MRLGNSKTLQKGDGVFAFAGPDFYDTKIAQGVLESDGKFHESLPFVPLLFATNNILRGYSGGPLVNNRREVVGIVTGCLRTEISPGNFVCVRNAYAVPINPIKEWLSREGIRYSE